MIGGGGVAMNACLYRILVVRRGGGGGYRRYECMDEWIGGEEYAV